MEQNKSKLRKTMENMIRKRKNNQRWRTRPGAIIAQETHPARSALSATLWTLAGINSPPSRVQLLHWKNHPAGWDFSWTLWTLAGINSPPGRVVFLHNTAPGQVRPLFRPFCLFLPKKLNKHVNSKTYSNWLEITILSTKIQQLSISTYQSRH